MGNGVFNIFKDGLMMSVHVCFWSGAKQLNAEDLGLKKEDVAEAYRLGKKMLVPDEVIKEFRTIEAKARYCVERNSFAFPIGNARFVPHNKVEAVTAELKDLRAQYLALTDNLIENYEQYRKVMIPVYTEAAETAYIRSTPETHTFGPDYDREAEKKQFIQNFLQRLSQVYPSAQSLRAKFDLYWDAYEITVPRSALSGEYQEQMRVKIEEFVADVVKVLRSETLDVCTRLKDSLTSGKAVHGKTLGSMANFVDRFRELNFVGDTEMEAALVKLRTDILSRYQADKLKHSENLRKELKRRVQEISDMAQFSDVSTITGQYKRQIQWDNGDDSSNNETPPTVSSGQTRKIQTAEQVELPLATTEVEEGQSVSEVFGATDSNPEPQPKPAPATPVYTEKPAPKATKVDAPPATTMDIAEGTSISEVFGIS